MNNLSRIARPALLAALALAACKKSEKSGPVVAEVGSETITADEVKQRLNETSPFLRARYNTLEAKKQFLENMVRNELLAQEAVRQGYDKSPAVRETVKRAMIQELIKHQQRARVMHIFLPAQDAKERADARKKAAALLKDIDAREKKGEVNAFQSVAIKESKDPLSAPMGGDLRFLSRDELAKSYNSELANAAFELKNPGDKAGPLDTPAGVELVKLQVKTAALSRSFEDSKEPIRQRMARERRSRDYDDWLKKLRESAKVTVHEQELEKIQVETAAAPGLPAPVAQPGATQAHPVQQIPSSQPAQSVSPTSTSKIGGN